MACCNNKNSEPDAKTNCSEAHMQHNSDMPANAPAKMFCPIDRGGGGNFWVDDMLELAFNGASAVRQRGWRAVCKAKPLFSSHEA